VSARAYGVVAAVDVGKGCGGYSAYSGGRVYEGFYR